MLKKYLPLVFGTLLLGLTSTVAAAENNFIGDKQCKMCHNAEVTNFASNIHAKAAPNASGAETCESCHGPGQKHKSTKSKADILNPATLGNELASTQCLSCHQKDARHWAGSSHDAMDVSCASCHSVHDNTHPDLLTKSTVDETCLSCHTEQRAYTLKRSTHPLNDLSRSDGQGNMTCSSCHNAHGTQTESLISANSINDKCYECHEEMKAPLLWEHSPVKENCMNCHNPHGSNNENLLVAKEPRLCQQCHEQGRHQTLAGEKDSFFVTNRGCSNCHAQVHGSNHPSGVKLKR
jgi:DmsE family decaheme c-type cytochrome